MKLLPLAGLLTLFVASAAAHEVDLTRLPLGDGKISTVERLLLPIADADGRVGHLFGVVAFGAVAAPCGDRGNLPG